MPADGQALSAAAHRKSRLPARRASAADLKLLTTSQASSIRNFKSKSSTRSHDWSRFPTLRSEIRLACLWDGKEALIEMIAIVLGTNHFMKRDFCRALVTPVALTCTPGHREGARVLHADKDVQRLAAIDQLKTLHNMELGRVRRTIVVDIGLVVEADCVD